MEQACRVPGRVPLRIEYQLSRCGQLADIAAGGTGEEERHVIVQLSLEDAASVTNYIKDGIAHTDHLGTSDVLLTPGEAHSRLLAKRLTEEKGRRSGNLAAALLALTGTLVFLYGITYGTALTYGIAVWEPLLGSLLWLCACFVLITFGGPARYERARIASEDNGQ